MVSALGIAYLVVGTLSFFLWAYGLVSFLVDVRRKVLPWLLARLGWGSDDDRDLRDRAGDGPDEGAAVAEVFADPDDVDADGDGDGDADPAPTTDAGGPIRPSSPAAGDRLEGGGDSAPRPDPDLDPDSDPDRYPTAEPRTGTGVDDPDPGATPGGDSGYEPDSTSPQSDGGGASTRGADADEG
jgi:hypothetical protein